MIFDFDTPVNRRGTDSVKWNTREGELPMWIADMDFRTAPAITDALLGRIGHGVYGYPEVPDEWALSYSGWWKRRYGFDMRPDDLIFCTGVVAAVSSVVRKLTTPNENVVIQTPVYNIFFNSIVNNGCRVLESPLTYENGAYSMDLDDLENKFSDPQTSLFILCNPHNPVGKIWTRDELGKIGELADKYGVTVISDEIHCDITRPGRNYIPFASVSDVCANVSVTCIAPTKSFNLAGIQTAAVYVENTFLRHKVWRGLNTDEVAEPNILACLAARTAYESGEEWLDQMREYVFRNRDRLDDLISRNIGSLKSVRGDATYLMWIDISGTNTGSDAFTSGLRSDTGLYLASGSVYGGNGGSFVRLNSACPACYIDDAFSRLQSFCGRYER